MRAVVFSIDDAYVMPFQVLFHSLQETASLFNDTPIFIIHEKTLSEQAITILKNFFSKYERKVDFLNATNIMPSSSCLHI